MNQTNKQYKCPKQIGTFGCSCENCYKEVMKNIEKLDQTNNRIREEWKEKLNKILWNNIDDDVVNCERPMKKQLAPDLENFIDELLKSQRDSLVEKIEKHQNFITMSAYDVGYNDCKENIINIIKEDNHEDRN